MANPWHNYSVGLNMDLRLEFLADYPEHLPQLARWHHEAFARLNPNASVEGRIEKLRSLMGRRAVPTTVVALDDHTLVGSASLVEHDMPGREDLSPWIAAVYVRRAYRRQGVGTLLVRHLESIARDLGIGRLYLFTPDMKPFYETLGWAVLEEVLFRGWPTTIMEKELTG